MSDPGVITALLLRTKLGELEAEQQLFSIVYDEVRRLARTRQLVGSWKSNSPRLDSRTLVHEVFLRLFRGPSQIDWQDRRHFYSIVARTLRRILVDHIRLSRAAKRNELCSTSSEADHPAQGSQGDLKVEELLELGEICDRLKETDPAAATVVDLRFYCGLTIQETSEVLGVSTTTVEARWAKARLKLHREMRRPVNA